MKKKTRFKILLVILSVLISVPLTVLSHSGRTDANGGHRDNKNVSGLGSYHYHHGYSAHLHPDGVCPYGGTTTKSGSKSSGSKSSGSGSGKSSGSSSGYKSTPKPTPTPTPTLTPTPTPTPTPPEETQAVALATYELNYDGISKLCIILGILILLCIPIRLLCRSAIKNEQVYEKKNRTIIVLGGIIVIILVAAAIAVLYNLT